MSGTTGVVPEICWPLTAKLPFPSKVIDPSPLEVLVTFGEVDPSVSSHDYGLSGITNYGVNQGDWFVWGGFNGPQNRNAFGMNRARRIAEFMDGTSNTLFASEVKTRQPGSRTSRPS